MNLYSREGKEKKVKCIKQNLRNISSQCSKLGHWSGVELSGKRPRPRCRAAMETIDQHRGLLHGGEDGAGVSIFADAFVIDLKEKVFLIICVWQ